MQRLLTPDAAGVMFTRNPITGADERMIEASWGLGEAVVAGLVIPDSFRLGRDGTVLESRPGLKRIAIRGIPGGGTVEEPVPPELQETLLPRRRAPRRAQRAGDPVRAGVRPRPRHRVGGRGDGLYLLQCRAVTRVGG